MDLKPAKTGQLLAWLWLAAVLAVAAALSQKQAGGIAPKPNQTATEGQMPATNRTSRQEMSGASKEAAAKQPNGLKISARKQARRLELDEQDQISGGVNQARRVARNVRRKVDQMSARMDQLDGIIAGDHDEHQPAAGGNQTDSIASPADQEIDQDENKNQVWSAQLDESDTVEPTPAAQNSSATATAVASGREWSSPVIRSVIPDRQQPPAPGADPSEERQNSALDSADYSISSGQQTALDGASEFGTKLTAGNRNHSDEQQMQMLRPEWNPNQNHDYFIEMNTKNHGGSGGLATGLLTDSYQQQKLTSEFEATRMGPAATGDRGKFQNMTVLSSETDLANSYSSVGPTTMSLTQAPPGHGNQSSKTDLSTDQANSTESVQVSRATTPRPGAHAPRQHGQGKRSSVVTYTAGKNSRTHTRPPSSSTSPAPVYSGAETSDTSEGPNWPQQHYQQQDRPSYFTDINQSGGGGGQQLDSPIGWPTMPTASRPVDQQHADQIGLPTGDNEQPGSSPYSSIMKAPSSIGSSRHRNHRDRDHQQHRSHRTSTNEESRQQTASNHRAPSRPTTDEYGSEQQANALGAATESSALSDAAIRFSTPVDSTGSTQPTPLGFGTVELANGSDQQNRRRLETRRQLTTSTESTIYDRVHQQQPPPLTAMGPIMSQSSDERQQVRQRPDSYSSRADHQSDLSLVANASNHLKHRSSSQPTAPDDQYQQATGGSAGDNSIVSLASSQQDQLSQQQQAATNNQPTDGSYNYLALANRPFYPTDARDSSTASLAAGAFDQTNQDGSESAHQFAAQFEQQLNEQQLQHSARPFHGHASPNYQLYSSPTSIQDALQAASSNQNEQQGHLLSRNQRSNQQLEPQSMISDYSQLLRYQSLQRQAAAALANHQRRQQQQAARSIARAYQEYAQPSGGQQAGGLDQASALAAAVQSGLLRGRYSAADSATLPNYSTARSSGQIEPNTAGVASSPDQAFYNQQYYQQASLSPSIYRAYQQLQQQAAAAQRHLQSSSPEASSYSLTGGSLQQLAAQPAAQLTSAATANSGQLYATSAMNQPVVYEPNQATATAMSSGGADTTPVAATGESGASPPSAARSPLSAWALSSNSGASNSGRRSYFTSLFKPTASSRFLYSPPLLAPISMASPSAQYAIYAPAAHHQQPAAHYHHQTQDSAGNQSPLYYASATNPYAALAMLNQAVANQHHHGASYQQTPALATSGASLPDAAQQLALAAAMANSYQQAAAAHYMNPAGVLSTAGNGVALSGSSSVADADMAESSLVSSDSSASFASSPGAQSDSAALASSNGDGSSPEASSSSSSGGKSMGSAKSWLTVASLLAGILPMGMVMASMLPMLTVAGRRKRELEFGPRNYSDLLGLLRPSRMIQSLAQQPLDSAASFANTTRLLNELVGSGPHRADGAELRASRQLDGGKSVRLLGAGPSGSIKSLLASTVSLLPGGKLLAPVVVTNATASQTPNSTALISPQPSTTPMPPTAGSDAATTNGLAVPAQYSTKLSLRRFFERFNHFITAGAQKRKHRSSWLDLQWLQQPMLDTNTFMRSLADLVRARILSDPQKLLPVESISSQLQQGGNGIASAVVASTREQPGSTRASGHDFERDGGLFGGNQSAPTPNASQTRPESGSTRVETQVQIQMRSDGAQNGTSANRAVAGQLGTPANEPLSSSATTMPRPQFGSIYKLAQLNRTKGQSEPAKPTRASLFDCLYRVLCESVSRMRRQSKLSEESTQHSLKELLNLIETADKEKLIFGQDLKGRLLGPTADKSNGTSNLSTVQQIQVAVLRDQCSQYVCLDAPQIKQKLLSELRLTGKTKP